MLSDFDSCFEKIAQHNRLYNLASNLTFYFNCAVILAGCYFRRRLETEPQVYVKFYLAAGSMMIALGLIDLYLGRAYCPASCKVCRDVHSSWNMYPFMAMFIGGLWIHVGMGAHNRAQEAANNDYNNQSLENFKKFMVKFSQRLSGDDNSNNDVESQSRYVLLAQG